MLFCLANPRLTKSAETSYLRYTHTLHLCKRFTIMQAMYYNVFCCTEEQQVKCESSCDDPFHRNGSAADVVESPDDFEIHHDVRI